MAAAVLQKLLGLVFTLLVVSLLLFVVMAALPGDPAAITLGTSASPDTLSSLRHEMGLDQSIAARYLAWLARALRGDFGHSYTYGVPAAGLILDRLTVTLPLAALAIALSILIALPLGVAAASSKGKVPDILASLLAQVGIAVPGFWVGLLLIVLFSTWLGWMPAGGFAGWSSPVSALRSLILPAIALALPQAGVLTRVVRTAMLDILDEDFVRTARAKGLSRAKILWRHVLPNALAPVVTIIGLQFTFLIAGAVLIENVFNLPGLGRLAYQALTQRDMIVMQDVVLFVAMLVVTVNFLGEIINLALDPRLRAKGTP